MHKLVLLILLFLSLHASAILESITAELEPVSCGERHKFGHVYTATELAGEEQRALLIVSHSSWKLSKSALLGAMKPLISSENYQVIADTFKRHEFKKLVVGDKLLLVLTAGMTKIVVSHSKLGQPVQFEVNDLGDDVFVNFLEEVRSKVKSWGPAGCTL